MNGTLFPLMVSSKMDILAAGMAGLVAAQRRQCYTSIS